MVQSSDQGLTQKGFASCWAYLTIVDPSKALEHMMYLGLPMDPAFMQRQFAISKTRQQERRRGKDFQGRALFQVSLASTCVTYCLGMLPCSFGVMLQWRWDVIAEDVNNNIKQSSNSTCTHLGICWRHSCPNNTQA
jgi:hypothetical protein